MSTMELNAVKKEITNEILGSVSNNLISCFHRCQFYSKNFQYTFQ